MPSLSAASIGGPAASTAAADVAAATGATGSGAPAAGPGSEPAASGGPASDATSVAAPAPATAAAPAPATAAAVGPSRASSSSSPATEASYSATELKTGSPAEAASARVAGSPDTIDSRFSWVSASRDRSRKLIRDVATREPYGSTTARRDASEVRMRVAAEVISSSTSR